jgi:hypothetical protein
MRRRYRKRPGQDVVAVQLKLDTAGFAYRKWGAEQRCKPGDWLVDNDGDLYTVDAAVFARTYRPSGKGTYLKTTPVWAEVAAKDGFVETKEGRSRYAAGDYLQRSRRRRRLLHERGEVRGDVRAGRVTRR